MLAVLTMMAAMINQSLGYPGEGPVWQNSAFAFAGLDTAREVWTEVEDEEAITLRTWADNFCPLVGAKDDTPTLLEEQEAEERDKKVRAQNLQIQLSTGGGARGPSAADVKMAALWERVRRRIRGEPEEFVCEEVPPIPPGLGPERAKEQPLEDEVQRQDFDFDCADEEAADAYVAWAGAQDAKQTEDGPPEEEETQYPEEPDEEVGPMEVRQVQAKIELAPAATEKGDISGVNTTKVKTKPVTQFALTVETFNGSCWAAARRRIDKAGADVHVFLIQETRLDEAAANEASRWLAARGWGSLWAPAGRGAKGGKSAGVAIVARIAFGLAGPAQGPVVVTAGRLVAGTLSLPGSREVSLMSVYMHDGEGISTANAAILQAIEESTSEDRKRGRQTIVGGDFNMTPEELNAQEFCEGAALTVIRSDPALGTCRRVSGAARVLDFFLVSEGIVGLIDKIVVKTCADSYPHWPVQMIWAKDAHEMVADQFVSPPLLPTRAVFGPRPPPPSYAEAQRAARRYRDATNHAVSARQGRRAAYAAYAEWAKAAEKELEGITDTPLTRRGMRSGAPKVKSQPVLAPRGADDSPEMQAAAGRKWAARAVSDLCALLESDEAALDEIEALLKATREAATAQNQRLATDMAEGMLNEIQLARENDNDWDEAGWRARCGTKLKESAAYADLEECTAEVRRERDRSWAAWARGAVEKGARKGHRWTQTPMAWVPTTATKVDGTTTADAQALADAYGDHFSKLWGASKDKPSESTDNVLPITPEMLRQASARFSHSTSIAADGFALRHFGLLSDEGLQTAADILMIYEAGGQLPPQLATLGMPMLPKATGGFRTIGLFAGLVRIWAKVRRTECDAWEAAHDRPYWGAGKGRRPLDPVWRWAADAESTPTSLNVGATLVDVSAFYESLDHNVLRAAAVKYDFPLAILEAALTLYTGVAWYVRHGPFSSKPRWATKGVVAGCSLATSLVKLYLLEMMDQLVVDFPRTELNVFIDDVGASTKGYDDDVVEEVAEITEEIKARLGRIGCELSEAKTVIVASCPKVSRRIGSRLGLSPRQVAADTAAKFLGADFAPRTARRKWIAKSSRRQRLRKAQGRAHRLRRLRAAAGPRAKLVGAAGLTPQAGYGTEVTGLSQEEWDKMRRAVAAGLGPKAGGRSLAVTLLMEGDPTIKVALAPALRWADEVWAAACGDKNACRLTQLIGMYHGAASRRPRTWGDVKGPIGAAWLTLQRAKWEWPAPFVFRSPGGMEYSLTEWAPAMIQKMMVQSAYADLEAQAAKTLAKRNATDPCDDKWKAQRVSVAAVTRVLGSKTRPLRALQAGCLRAVAAGAVWPQGRLADEGYAVEEECVLCRKHRDSLWHRWWQCPATQHLRLDENLVPKATRLRATAAREGNALYERALMPHPAEKMPLPSEDADACWWQDEAIDPDAPQIFEKTVYVDGSCTTHAIHESRRAAWAAVEVDPDSGKVLRCWSGAVPRAYCQTPQAAEFLAIHFLVPRLRHGAKIASDCANVIRQFGMEAVEQLRRRRPFAGISRALNKASAVQATVVAQMRKVPAHVTEDECTSAGAKADARGNGAADSAAKAALQVHPSATPATTIENDCHWNDAVATARLIAAAGPMWPAAKPPDGRRLSKVQVERSGCADAPPNVRRARRVRRREATHAWGEHRGVSRCNVCWARRSATGVAASADCPGKAPMHANICKEAPKWGHDLHVAELIRPRGETSNLLICTQCGAYSEIGDNPVLHSAACTGPRSQHGWDQISRARRGLHPRSGAVGRGVILQGLRRLPVVA